VLLTLLVQESNRSPRSRRSCRSRSPVCGTGSPRTTPTRALDFLAVDQRRETRTGRITKESPPTRSGERDPQTRGRILRPGEHPPKVVFPLVRELADDGFDVAVTCRVLGVRRQGFYEWRSGVKSARSQGERTVAETHRAHPRRVARHLRLAAGARRARPRAGHGGQPQAVARLMRKAGIQGLYRRRRHGCTVRDLQAEPYHDLVDRDFVVDGPDEIWCTDVTEHRLRTRGLDRPAPPRRSPRSSWSPPHQPSAPFVAGHCVVSRRAVVRRACEHPWPTTGLI